MIYMANEQQQITNFELPRPDWHDDKGRIYKDALIENFNAIEAKLTDIAELSAVSTNIPDISGVTFEDVTLGSDDEMIVNLRSFLKLFPIVGYPVECQFTGITAKRVCYWKENGTYKILSNKKISSASSSSKWIILDYANDTITSSSNPTTNGTQKLIGCYCEGEIKHINSDQYCNINYLQYLSRMNWETVDEVFSAGNRERHGIYYPSGNPVNNYAGTRIVGTGDTNKKTPSGWSFTATFRDVGRTARKTDEL